jgi:hypothetical protein
MNNSLTGQVNIEFNQSALIQYVLGSIFACVGLFLLLQIKTVPFWFSLIFLGVGILIIIIAKSIHTVINQNAKKIMIVTSGITGKKTVEIGFDQVREVAVVESISRNNSKSGGTTSTHSYTLTLRCVDGNDYQLKSVSQSFTIAGFEVGPSPRKNLAEKGTQLANIIGVKFVDQRLPSVGEVLNVMSAAVKESIAKAQAEKIAKESEK